MVVSVWNVLPEVGTILSFKKHLDSYMGKIGIKGYGPKAGKSEKARVPTLIPGEHHFQLVSSLRNAHLYLSFVSYLLANI